jgi:hypothetical protein
MAAPSLSEEVPCIPEDGVVVADEVVDVVVDVD